ncbi:hypothetical protein C497_06769 [Halalkalicoccus jeotgali B3]|uniref:Uncharacterized protein n=1 Tax=Halalkalicoccus jeotgali (strain DSM 18796 / CECT 7217 / JCM 14584 / KCTC 4019 / B3) TaxID=795797 RepID=D8JC34_HALJB|nr:hypothetical protein HacjB3_17993 [Halalkalicoccus jeotgali B3]ELY38622.1 hypothetical protein C497_06769 [Halalkalicoccus jeotgali B3]
MEWLQPRSPWDVLAGFLASIWALFTLHIHWLQGTNFFDLRIMLWVLVVTAVCLGVLLLSGGLISGQLYRSRDRYLRAVQALGGSALVMFIVLLII